MTSTARTRATPARPTQWERYAALMETDAATTDRVQAAGTYANWLETPDTTDEEWAEAFWNAYHNEPRES